MVAITVPNLYQSGSWQGPNRYKYEHANGLYYLATHGVKSPHRFTIDERDALDHFGVSECKNTPHLLGYSAEYISEGLDPNAMPKGYTAFILMTKAPGEALDYEMFWEKDEKTRENIRRAFKAALM